MNAGVPRPWRWAGGVAVVTGAAGLLGRAFCHAFAARGMRIVAADMDLAGAERVAADASASGVEALACTVDVADPASVAALADAAFARFGRVDLLCNNAGITQFKPYADLTIADWDRMLAINLKGVIHGTHYFQDRMGAGEARAQIVNTASMSGIGLADMRGNMLPYVAAKFGVVGMSEGLRAVLSPRGIGVSVLCPGFVVADPAAHDHFPTESGRWYADELLGAEAVAAAMVVGVEADRLYILPHRMGLGEVEQRHATLLDGFAHAGVPTAAAA